MTDQEILNIIRNNDIESLQNWINNGGDVGIVIKIPSGKKSLIQLVINEIDQEGDDLEYFHLLKMLIENGASVNFFDDVSFSPIFSLIDLENSKLLKLILESGADLNIVNDELETPLIRAVRNGDQQIITVLLDFADTELINKAGSFLAKTPLGIALFNADKNIIEILLKHNANPYSIDNEGEKTIESIPTDIDSQLKFEIMELINKYSSK